MKFYISARYSRRQDAEDLGHLILENGHNVTSRWVWREQPDNYEVMEHEEVAQLALEDIDDVIKADALIALSEPSDNPYGRGGRHVEYGYALACGMVIIVIGPLENIFHYMNEVSNFETVDEFIDYLKENV